jgi:hypothetical protein
MSRLLALVLIACWPGLLLSQTRPTNAPSNDQGTYLGVLFAPTSAPATGVRLTHVFPDSPAAKAGLKPDDVLVEYDGIKVQNCEHLATLIRRDKPERKVMLSLQREGKALAVAAMLTIGPALVLPGEAKPIPTGSITVAAKPLPDGKMRLTVEFIGATGKTRPLVCEGTPGMIDAEVAKLPEDTRTLVKAALEQIRKLTRDGPPKRDDEKK